MNAVEIEQVSHFFPGTRGHPSPRKALDQLSLSVQAGEIFGLLGPNGGGKTTLFRILSTQLLPSAGSVFIFESDVVREPHRVRQKIGVVFQHPSLDGKLTLRENMIHQGHLYGLKGHELEERINRLVHRFSLGDRVHEIVEHLSGGLQRRGEIAKGLLHKPSLLLMDEPSTGLDPGARREMWSYFKDLKKDGVTILLTTHLMEEAENCDRVGILHHGRLVTVGSPSDLKKRIGGDVVSIQTANPEGFCGEVQKRFSLKAVVLDDTIRIETLDGHKFLPQLVEAFPGLISSVTIGKPTLEDVFVHETGQRFVVSLI